MWIIYQQIVLYCKYNDLYVDIQTNTIVIFEKGQHCLMLIPKKLWNVWQDLLRYLHQYNIHEFPFLKSNIKFKNIIPFLKFLFI